MILGSIGYLAFDIAAFAAGFAAFGSTPPFGPLVFGYVDGGNEVVRSRVVLRAHRVDEIRLEGESGSNAAVALESPAPIAAGARPVAAKAAAVETLASSAAGE